MAAGEQRSASQPDDMPFIPAEPKWLFSNRNYWYPQGQVTDYATATLRITVPADYAVVGSGVPRRWLARGCASGAARCAGRGCVFVSTRRSRFGISAW